MNLISIFTISFIIALSGALAPGPFLATVIYESAQKGARTGFLMILGHAVLEVVMIGMIILGFHRFMENPLALKTISLLGAAILFWFAIQMMSSLKRLTLDFKKDYKNTGNLILKGITTSLANPYWSIWWLTIGLGLLMTAKNAGFLGILIFFIGHILADLSWYSLVSFIISKGRNFLSLHVYKGIIFTCAVTLVGFSIWFLISSF
jgi:threonine/homoserine/homoserine lactone efflux protein